MQGFVLKDGDTHGMSKQINEMTPDELGQLYPIILSDYQDHWVQTFQNEKDLIKKAIGKDILRIEHIGSTSIPGIKAKPTIDILVEINTQANLLNLIKQMQEACYQYSEKPENPAPHMMFMKGYTLEGFKGQTIHVHVRYFGDWDEIHFRDYLRSHKNVAKEYEELKIELQKKHEHNREDYTKSKTVFIKKVLCKAKEGKKVPLMVTLK
jgi:GrpB-like predicted nucleotidyltransferase (UPF0157 family)